MSNRYGKGAFSYQEKAGPSCSGNPPVPPEMALTKRRKTRRVGRTWRRPVFCLLIVNSLLLSLFSPLRVLCFHCLQTLRSRSSIFLSTPSIRHLTIDYLHAPGSNKRLLALILLPGENVLTTGNTYLSISTIFSVHNPKMYSFLSSHPEPASHHCFMSLNSMQDRHLKAIHSFCPPVLHACSSRRITDHSVQYLLKVCLLLLPSFLPHTGPCVT